MPRLQVIGPWSSLPSEPPRPPFEGRIPTSSVVRSVNRNTVGEQVAAGRSDDLAGLDRPAFRQHGPSRLEDLRARLQLEIPHLIGRRRASGCLLNDLIDMD